MSEIVSPEGQSVLFFHFWVIFVQIAGISVMCKAKAAEAPLD
jgi:hypothetical protein